MNATIFSATTIGVTAHDVEVEVDLSLGLMQFSIVGLPDRAIKESRERVRAALKNSGLRLPERVITVNLAPAHLKKQNVLFDVPIAIAILQAANQLSLSSSFINETLFLGELSLHGEIKPVTGILPIVHRALESGKRRVIVPAKNQNEASLVRDIEVIGVDTLVSLVAFLRGEKTIQPTVSSFKNHHQQANHPFDFSQVVGQWQAKRALQIAAAGKHNVLFIGPPGSGKTMLAQRLSSILPPMSFKETIEVTKIYSVAGLLNKEHLVSQRPFRSPHHTISQAGLVGGGSMPRPGEISLAHNGVLFLDELTEFKRPTLEVLRQPLESKRVCIARAQSSIEFPASFLLIAALNPCPCGFFGDTHKRCICTPQQISSYFGKLSGPLLDRIDLHVTVPSIPYQEFVAAQQKTASSKEMKQVVDNAIAAQKNRQGDKSNALLQTDELKKVCSLSTKAKDTLAKSFDRLGLSMRGYHKILKIARTIADMAGETIIDYPHVQEATMYRSLDKVNSQKKY